MSKKYKISNLNIDEIALATKGAVPAANELILKALNDAGGDTGLLMKHIPFAKKDEVKKQVFGYVLVPDVADSQGDVVTAEDIEKAAHSFAKNLAEKTQKGNGASVNHTEFNNDSYIIETTIDHDGSIAKHYGVTPQPGGWWIGRQVTKVDLWEQIEKGEIQGQSIGGMCKRVSLDGSPAEKSFFPKLIEAIKKSVGAISKEGAESFQEAYSDRQIREDLWDIFIAIEDSIRSIIDDDAVTDKATAVSTSIDQFKNQMLAFVGLVKSGVMLSGKNSAIDMVNSLTKTIENLTTINTSDEGGSSMNLADLEMKIQALDAKIEKLANPGSTDDDPSEVTKTDGGDDPQPDDSTKKTDGDEELTDLQKLQKAVDDLKAEVAKLSKKPQIRKGGDAEGDNDPEEKPETRVAKCVFPGI